MAAIDLTVNPATESGNEPVVQTGVTAAATDQYFIPNNGNRTILRVSNGAAAAAMTVVTGKTFGGLAVADPVVNIPAGETRLYNFRPDIYNDADGKVQLTFAAADASLELEVIRA